MSARARRPRVRLRRRGGATCRSRTTTPARREQLDARRRARSGSSPGSSAPTPQGRPEREVRRARARQPRHRARRLRARHAARVVRARSARARTSSDSLAQRHLRLDHAHLRRRRRQGRGAHPVRPGRRRRAPPSTRREDADCTLRCTSAAGRRSRRTRSSSDVYERDRDAGAAGALPHGAQRRAARPRDARRAEPRARRARCSQLEQQAYEAAGQPFNLGSPEADPARSCSTG